MKIETKVRKCYLVECVIDNVDTYYQSEIVFTCRDDANALKAAIKALEQQLCVHDTCMKCVEFSEFKQQPSEDCISRADVINAIESEDKLSFMGAFCSHDCAMGFIETIKELPSVTPQQKIGKWKYTTHHGRRYRVCIACNCEREDDLSTGWNYCPYCGAKMEVEE